MLALAGGASPVTAAEPGARFFVRSRTVVDAYQLRRLDGHVTQTRAVGHRVDLAATGDGVLAVFGGSFGFDEGRPSRPGAPESRELQLQPTLHRASVRWFVGSHATVEAGRHDLVGSTLGLARLDGFSARASFDAARFQLHVGVRPDDAIIRFDDASYLPDTEREARDRFGDHTGLVEASAEVYDRVGAARIGVRHEVSIDGDYRDGTRIGLGLRAGPSDRTHASAGLRMRGQLGDLERYDLVGTARHRRATVALIARRSAAVFPVDSIYSVFPISHYEEQLIRLSVGEDLRVNVAAVARASGAEQPDRLRSGGGSLGLSHRHPLGTEWDVHATIVGGERGSEVRTVAAIAARPQRGPRWRASHVLSLRSVRHTGLERTRLATFARLGTHWRIDDWSDMSISTDTGWDDRNRASFRVFATADIALPGGAS